MFGRDGFMDALDQIAMRINQSEATACAQVLERHCFNERGLADPGLAYDVDMRKTVGLFDAKRHVSVSEICAGEIGDVSGLRHAPILRSGSEIEETVKWDKLEPVGRMMLSTFLDQSRIALFVGR